MRPSVREVQTPSGNSIIIDTALASSKNVLVAAIGSAGQFSSKVLSESHLAAFSAGPEVGSISASDVLKVMEDSGFPIENGVVIVKEASKKNLKVFDNNVVVEVEEQATLDHVISLLSSVNTETK